MKSTVEVPKNKDPQGLPYPKLMVFDDSREDHNGIVILMTGDQRKDTLGRSCQIGTVVSTGDAEHPKYQVGFHTTNWTIGDNLVDFEGVVKLEQD